MMNLLNIDMKVEILGDVLKCTKKLIVLRLACDQSVRVY